MNTYTYDWTVVRDWTKDHPCYAIPNEWILAWAAQHGRG